MINPRKLIEQYKAKARQRETEQTIKEAQKLKDLRKERLRAEGRAKVQDLVKKEQARIKKAKYKTSTKKKIKDRVDVIKKGAKKLKKQVGKPDKSNPWQKSEENNPWK